MRWPFGKRNNETGFSVDRSFDQKANFIDAFGSEGEKKYQRWLFLYKKYNRTPEERTELVQLTEIADKFRP